MEYFLWFIGIVVVFALLRVLANVIAAFLIGAAALWMIKHGFMDPGASIWWGVFGLLVVIGGIGAIKEAATGKSGVGGGQPNTPLNRSRKGRRGASSAAGLAGGVVGGLAGAAAADALINGSADDSEIAQDGADLELDEGSGDSDSADSDWDSSSDSSSDFGVDSGDSWD